MLGELRKLIRHWKNSGAPEDFIQEREQRLRQLESIYNLQP